MNYVHYRLPLHVIYTGMCGHGNEVAGTYVYS
jgi:hypothetical protein